jgi:hypothetical protein
VWTIPNSATLPSPGSLEDSITQVKIPKNDLQFVDLDFSSSVQKTKAVL